MFQLDSIDTVLNQPGVQYKIAKKIIRDGEEWLGIVPEQLVLERGALAWFQRGYSLVIDKLERHWASVATLARKLERSLGLSHVSCNLYLTPANNASGFEAHWDWMDVIVIQLEGTKLWSVARNPTVYLSTESLKRKPTPKELMSLKRYDDVLLNPGDILYIPRGTIHNASTPVASAEPSLHVTFGLEPTNCLVGNWISKVVVEERGHQHENTLATTAITSKLNLDESFTALRQSLPIWKRNDEQMLRRIWDEAIEEMPVEVSSSSWEKASKALDELEQQRLQERNVRWERDDTIYI